MGSFKKLEVFNLAIQYVKSIYRTADGFPRDERFGLAAQLRRSAISIPSSIAEGTSRRTAVDRRHFVDLALGSLHESHAQLILARELGYIDADRLTEAEKFIGSLRKKLYAYHKSIRDRSSGAAPNR